MAIFNRIRDPNARVWARYYSLSNGVWGFTIRDQETDVFVANRLGFVSYEDAVAFAAKYWNIE